ncbi:MAG: hypothetical protein QME28_01665 [Candidatus Saccharicenans sp.]|nr:hypothetical protein [Candidatus Saccharicenans sp.]
MFSQKLKFLWKLTAVGIVVMMIFSLAGPAYSQQKRHEFSAGYGTVTTSQIVDIFTNVILISLTLGEAAKVDNKYPGAFVFSYKYSGGSRLGLGLTFAADRASGNLAMSGNPVGTYTENYYTGALEIDFRYINRENFCLYSGLGAGVTVRKGEYRYSDTEKSSSAYPVVQVTLLGFRLGNRIALFGEVGGGYKGVVHGGVRITL